MFDDGPIMNLLDSELILTAFVVIVFLVLYCSLRSFERSRTGWLVVSSWFILLIACLGSILYRLGLPDTAQWFFIPICTAVPIVVVWWTALMLASPKSKMMALLDNMGKEAWDLVADGKGSEAAVLFRVRKELGRVLGFRTP